MRFGNVGCGVQWLVCAVLFILCSFCLQMKKKADHRLFPRLTIPDERPLNEDLLLVLKSSVRPLAELYNDVAVPKQVGRCEGG